MRQYYTLLLFVLVLSVSTEHFLLSQPSATWKVFTGAWFDVEYPANFKAKPSMKSRSSADGYDSAFFSSPDVSVEFYVYSPQWNGEPSDIEPDVKTETVTSKTFEEKDGVKTRRVTVKAKNNTYTRLFTDTENTTLNTRVVFGIKYKDEKAYKKFIADYLTFKESLRQFAD